MFFFEMVVGSAGRTVLAVVSETITGLDNNPKKEKYPVERVNEGCFC